jgi:hypothetical protein
MTRSKFIAALILIACLTALSLLFFCAKAEAATLHLTWTANTEADLSGYTINYVAPGDAGWTLASGKWSYTGAFVHQVELGKVTAWDLVATPGPYAVVLRAKDTSGNLSDYSAVVQALVTAPPIAPVVIPIDAAPGKPMTITITVQ